MNREDITRWATQCKMPYDYVTGEIVQIEKLESFAALVAAAEREACANAADEHMQKCEGKSFGVGAAIRARGRT